MTRTRLSQLHPYPAMVADDLAIQLASKHLRPGDCVLDPFCGSGRLLAAAAAVSANGVGIDANPLAWLLTSAKLGKPRQLILRTVLDAIPIARQAMVWVGGTTLGQVSRRVAWFPKETLYELGLIVTWLNSLKMARPERLVIAAALSAASRDVSFARKSGWKLHRMSAESRNQVRRSAWDCFERRLKYCVDEIARQPAVSGDFSVHLGDSRHLLASGAAAIAPTLFDVVLTSPPYGDSRTTVQYGAASTLCMDIVSHLVGLEYLRTPASTIDSLCLGGTGSLASDDLFIERYWAGSGRSPQAQLLRRFLSDYAAVCAAIAARVKPNGKVVMVVGRRSVGGFRLKLDEFTVHRFESHRFVATDVSRRRLIGKRLPRRINRFGRALSKERRALGATTTMLVETIVTMSRRK